MDTTKSQRLRAQSKALVQRTRQLEEMTRQRLDQVRNDVHALRLQRQIRKVQGNLSGR